MSSSFHRSKKTRSHELTRNNSSVVYLVHIALEIPVAIQGLWSPVSLPFLELNNTTLVILKVSTSRRPMTP